jgi:ribonuclease J
MWEGYLKKTGTKEFISYLTKRKFSFHIVHTSGHADIKELKNMADALKPKVITPIHTFEAGRYKNIFQFPVVELNDRKEIIV